MCKYYKAYEENVVLDFDLDKLLDQSVNAFKVYLEEVENVFQNNFTYITCLQKRLSIRGNLTEGYKGYLESFIEYKDGQVTADSFHRMRFIPQYIRLEVLIELVGRDVAIDFTKEYIDKKIMHLPQRGDGPTCIEDLRKMQIEANIAGKDMDWIGIRFNDNSYCNIVTKCRIHEVLKGYDKDLMEVLACYPDFAMFKTIDENFILTRTCTLIGGGPYCDTCYHDAKQIETFDHPDDTFMRNQLSLHLF